MNIFSELADTWDVMAAMETDAEPARRATLRECADTVRMLAARPGAAPAGTTGASLDAALADVLARHTNLSTDAMDAVAPLLAAQARLTMQAFAAPVDMILHCPACGMQHVDAPDERTPGWTNPPHRSHLCHGCGYTWRPANVPTNGVESIAPGVAK